MTAKPMPLTYFKRFRMEVDLLDRDFPAVLPPGYWFAPWDTHLVLDHASAKFMSFRAEVDANVFPCLGEEQGCRRLMREIARKDGFLGEATWLVQYQFGPGEPIENIGTVQGIRDRAGFGAIQNLGIVPSHRGRGVGRALLFKALDGFQKRGLRRAFLEVTAQNEFAIRLYEQVGFRKVRTVYKAVEVAVAATV